MKINKIYALNYFDGSYRNIMGIFSSYENAVDAFVKNVDIDDEEAKLQYSKDLLIIGQAKYGDDGEVWWIDTLEMDKYECIND